MTEIKSGRKAADVRLFIAIPAMDSKLFCATTGLLLDTQVALIQAGITQTPHVEFAMQESNLPFGRNRILAQFMKTDCTDLICIDSDISTDLPSFMRLVCHPVDFVGATYRQKIQQPGTDILATRYAIEFLESETITSDPETGLLEVKRLPAGFFRVTRSAIQRMINECGAIEYDHETYQGESLRIYRLFENHWDGKQDVGEDYTFCDRWRKIGGKVWCDPELRVDHHGHAVWHGHLGGHLRSLQAEQHDEKLTRAIEAVEERHDAIDADLKAAGERMQRAELEELKERYREEVVARGLDEVVE